jgi:hypothetical protein
MGVLRYRHRSAFVPLVSVQIFSLPGMAFADSDKHTSHPSRMDQPECRHCSEQDRLGVVSCIEAKSRRSLTAR